MEGFGGADKAVWLRSVFDRWSDVDIVAVQESPTSAELGGLAGRFKLLGSCRSHAAGRWVQLYVRHGVRAHETNQVKGAPAVAAWLTIDTSQLLVVSVHLAPGRDGVKTRASQMSVIVNFVDRELEQNTSDLNHLPLFQPGEGAKQSL